MSGIFRKDGFLNRGAHFLSRCLKSGWREAVRRDRETREGSRLRKIYARGEELSLGERKAGKGMPDGPVFRIYIRRTGGTAAERRETEQSIRAQSYSRWHMAEAADPEIEKEDACLVISPGDRLHPAALAEFAKALAGKTGTAVYADEEAGAGKGHRGDPRFKPDFAPDSLRGINYIGSVLAFTRDLAEEAGITGDPAAPDPWDLNLRITEKARETVHISRVLVYRRRTAETHNEEAETAVLRRHLARIGTDGIPEKTGFAGVYRIRYAIQGEPMVSILIPNRDHAGDLRKCIYGIREKTAWRKREILILENGSRDAETFRLYEELEQDPEIRIIRCEGEFNFSAVNNRGAREADGEYLVLLNNDTEIVAEDWIREMLMYAQRKDVGAVGAKLLYPDGTVQHAGLGIGLLMAAGHYFRGFPGDAAGYMNRLAYAQEVSAVTGACMMVRRDVYEEINGMDESFPVAFNDVDFCLRLREAGYRVIWTPWAKLVHAESKSRGQETVSRERRKRFRRETAAFQKRWAPVLEAGDPAYNPNLTREREDFSFRV